MASIKELEERCIQVRRDIVRMVHAVNSGHPGGSLGCAEFLVALYGDIMDYSTDFKMDGKNEDVFILSNGHISPVFYSVLARSGYFPIAELATFRKLNSRLQGHPTTHEGLPGVRIATGSLGQGLSVGLGLAESKKLNGDDKTIFVLQGDGELQEGQVWESYMYAGSKNIDNVVVTIDRNHQQIDGSTDKVMDLGDLKVKLEAFGWDVLELKEGNNMEKVVAVLKEAQAKTGNGKPIAIVLHTEMGNGVDFMMGSHKWHGVAPNDEQLAQALEQNYLKTENDY